jgi:hypothetical protein
LVLVLHVEGYQKGRPLIEPDEITEASPFTEILATPPVVNAG